MGLIEFKLIFDNPEKTYYSGETLKARIFAVLDSPKTCRGIKVKIKGIAETCWNKNKQIVESQANSSGYQVILSGREEYFSATHYVAKANFGDKLELPPGEYFFPFETDLPLNIPSSVDSRLGQIRFTIEVIIERPWKFDYKIEEEFTVISTYDLNMDPRASKPVMVERVKIFGCCCWTTPPITVNLSLPVKGYVSGQSIPIKLNVENKSNIKIYDVELKLQQYVTYRVTSPRSDKKTRCITVAEINKGPIASNDDFNFEVYLKIPCVQPSTLNKSKLINIKYSLEFEALIDGCYCSDLKTTTEILIGTVPLANCEELISPIEQDSNRISFSD